MYSASPNLLGSYVNIHDKFVWLVVEPTHLKNMLVKNGLIFPKDRGENSKHIWAATT